MVRSQPEMSANCIERSDSLYRNRLRSLLGVDDMVNRVADLLESTGELDNTYLIYTSDHGFHLGEFRMPMFKCQPYDTDITVPFFIRGPGIRPGHVITDKIGLNIDVAPTIAALVGTAPPAAALVDGRSLTPLLFAQAQDERLVSGIY
jgi:arylsulfatase A-like enzyme